MQFVETKPETDTQRRSKDFMIERLRKTEVEVEVELHLSFCVLWASSFQKKIALEDWLMLNC